MCLIFHIRHPYSWFYAILVYSFLFSLFDVAKIPGDYGVYSSILRYFLLLECLLACGSLKSAFDYYSRASRIFPGDLQLVSIQEGLEHKLRSHYESRNITWDQKDIHVGDYPERGHVRRELYPWNSYEPDRFSAESIQFLNNEMSNVAPKLEVVATNLPLLDAGKVASDG